jgi:serine/threonine protein kinase
LVFLHDMAVVHRDLKPDNVLLDDGGECKIADFGSSKRLLPSFTHNGEQGQQQPQPQPADTTLKGTPYYMAPEQMLREDTATKSDVWSLGGVALFMATGDFPWKHAAGFQRVSELNPFAFFFKVRELVEVTPLVGLPQEKHRLLVAPHPDSGDSPNPNNANAAAAGGGGGGGNADNSSSDKSRAKSPRPLLPLLERCFIRDPDGRASASDLLNAMRLGQL